MASTVNSSFSNHFATGHAAVDYEQDRDEHNDGAAYHYKDKTNIGVIILTQMFLDAVGECRRFDRLLRKLRFIRLGLTSEFSDIGVNSSLLLFDVLWPQNRLDNLSTHGFRLRDLHNDLIFNESRNDRHVVPILDTFISGSLCSFVVLDRVTLVLIPRRNLSHRYIERVWDVGDHLDVFECASSRTYSLSEGRLDNSWIHPVLC